MEWEKKKKWLHTNRRGQTRHTRTNYENTKPLFCNPVPLEVVLKALHGSSGRSVRGISLSICLSYGPAQDGSI